jgi:pantoate--beta-alanine ligase
MLIHETIAGLRAARAGAGTVALVPTMGNLHEGHIALMTQARAHADQVIATIFVNRLQFRPGEDFEKYPRTFEADCEKLAAAGVEHVFAPGEAEMYPQPQTYHVDPPSDQAGVLDGEFRPGHFRGVATVVMKLFQIAQADVALFGKKDYQQLMVIRNMVREFNLPLEIVPGETVRAADGLALSSRNGYLSASERAEAPRLYQLLSEIAAEIRQGARNYAELEAKAMNILGLNGWVPDYVAVRKNLIYNRRPLTIPSWWCWLRRVWEARASSTIWKFRVPRCAHAGGIPAVEWMGKQLPWSRFPFVAPLREKGLTMQRTMLKSKLHRVTVTHAELHYEGSCAIDENLLDAADIKEYQQIDVYNVNNGERFTTYAIRAERGSGTISVNGAAARKAATGDLLIIATYATMNEIELQNFEPDLVYVDSRNRISHRCKEIPAQVAA